MYFVRGCVILHPTMSHVKFTLVLLLILLLDDDGNDEDSFEDLNLEETWLEFESEISFGSWSFLFISIFFARCFNLIMMTMKSILDIC